MGKRLVCGVGINNTNDLTIRYGKVDGKSVVVWRCQAYRIWASTLRRCYTESCLIARPKYRGCKVCSEWLYFSNFKEWFEANYIEGYQIEKDLLVEGNEVYSPSTCVFVPISVNNFITLSDRARGNLPLGVSYHKVTGKLSATCKSVESKKSKHLGLFEDAQEAHKAWQSYKLKQAFLLQSQQTEVVATALQRIITKLQHHINNNIETKDL